MGLKKIKMGIFDKLFGRREEVNSGNAVLLVITGFVYCWRNGKIKKIGGSGLALNICEHNSTLYESGTGGVCELYSGDVRPVANRDDFVQALCSHDGKLYDCTSGGPRGQGKIYETFSNMLIAERDRNAFGLFSHGGKLYDGGDYGVYETFTNRRVAERPCMVLSSHNGRLYDGGDYGVYETFTNVEVGEGRVPAMCSHEGRLYHVNAFDGIYDTLGGLKVLDYEEVKLKRTGVTAMISVSSKLCRDI